LKPEIRPGLVTALVGPRDWEAGAALRGLLAALPESVLVRPGARELVRTRSPEEGQRLALERKLAGGAKVLLLEAPRRGLEPLLRCLSSEHTVVIATHDLAQAARLADRTALLDAEGSLLEQGETAQLLAAPSDDRAEAYLRAESGSEAARGELDRLEASLQEEGALVLRELRGALNALAQRDVRFADDVIALGEDIHRASLRIEKGIRHLLALRLLVATELRLALAMLHANLDLEHMAGEAATIAKLTKLVADVEPDPLLLQSLEEMGERAEEMIRVALDAFANRDLEAAESLVELDELIDRSDRRFVDRIVEIVGEPGKREWVLRMVLVSRTLERIGDHAVDIGEQMPCLLMAEFRRSHRR
jgi:phosphate transport system protein